MMTRKIISSILILLVAFTFTTLRADDNVFRAQFTTQVSDKEPVDNLSELENSFTSVFFFTDIRDCVNCKIEHSWYLNNKHVTTVKGKAKYKRYRWWSRKTLTDDMIGTWTVKVKVNGKVRAAKKLTYFKPSAVQKQTAPIKKRLQLNGLDECEEKLTHFHKMTKEHPDDPYYDFMFKKWGSRCYGE